mmetsp:Transcript_19561/g.52133  ORF Transcript_19561/g.52133 Transcript_19561/m.52133 type:complete len:246 (+) Transcript_19561:582-1319(+)
MEPDLINNNNYHKWTSMENEYGTWCPASWQSLLVLIPTKVRLLHPPVPVLGILRGLEQEEESGFQVGQAFACSCLPAEHIHIQFSLTVGAQERLKVLCRVRLVLAEEFDEVVTSVVTAAGVKVNQHDTGWVQVTHHNVGRLEISMSVHKDQVQSLQSCLEAVDLGTHLVSEVGVVTIEWVLVVAEDIGTHASQPLPHERSRVVDWPRGVELTEDSSKCIHGRRVIQVTGCRVMALHQIHDETCAM